MKKLSTFLILSGCILLSHHLSGQVTLYTEGFDYPPGELPPGWVLDADQPPQWSVNNAQIAGGEAPELYLGYSMAAGLSRLISPVIDIEGNQELAVIYKQYLINYAGDWGETIGMDVTFDGGDSWQALWEQPLWLLNIPQDQFAYYVKSPGGAVEMQLAFRFEGNNMGINAWAIDDIMVQEVINNDLLISDITGNTTPNVGEETVFTVEVINGGKISQSNYIVKLMTQEGAELASVPGDQIDFAENKSHSLSWTPTGGNLGNHVVYAVIEFDDDENPANDQSKSLNVNVLSQNTENVYIGTEAYPLTHSIPFNFFDFHSLSQTLYTAEEIGKTDAPITGIQYICQFDDDIQDVPVQIYMAETSQDNLSTEWLDPASFTLVYDGLMDFHRGLNTHYIPLDEPFEYNGSNLVIYSNKSHPEQVLWSAFLSTLTDNPIRSRQAKTNEEPYDPMNPAVGFPVFYNPNITLFFSSGGMSVIDSEDNQASVIVYPNPASNVLHMQTKNGEEIQEIRLLNANGQVLYQENTAKNILEVDIKNLSSGFYLVQIKTSNGILVKKILVN